MLKPPRDSVDLQGTTMDSDGGCIQRQISPFRKVSHIRELT